VGKKIGIRPPRTVEADGEKSTLRSLELFVGAGGLALGIARAGFSHVAVIDSHEAACETLRLNKRNAVCHVCDWEVVKADAGRINFGEYQRVDLLGGGPPCQPFSRAGKRTGRADCRDMFPHFIRAVRDIQPKGFIVENVKGLVGRSFSSYFSYVVQQLRFPLVTRRHGEKWTEHRARLEKLYTGGKYTGAHYNVIWQSLNAADFGVPQHRERVFIVGIRADLGVEYSFPLPTHSRAELLRDQWIGGAYWDRHGMRPRCLSTMPQAVQLSLPSLGKTSSKPVKRWRTVRDAIADLPRVAVGKRSRKVSNHFLNPGARIYDGHDGSDLDMPAKTIKAGHHGVPGGENIIRLDDGSVRYFSVRECARLQTFPDDWTFDGSWTGCMKQLGNAVPVNLAAIVAEPLAKSFRSTAANHGRVGRR
jgi:DNA (cytosine-5)-methyltransferase 1